MHAAKAHEKHCTSLLCVFIWGDIHSSHAITDECRLATQQSLHHDHEASEVARLHALLGTW